MKIAIDARFYGPEGTGIGKYAAKLLENLEKIDQKNDYVVFLKKSNFDLYQPQSANFKKILVDANWYSVKEQYLIPRVLNQIKPDLVHFTHYNVPLLVSQKFVVTIYDVIKMEFGQKASTIKNHFVYTLKQRLFRETLKRASQRATTIIAGSKTTKEKLVGLFGLPEKKVVPIYAGTNEPEKNVGSLGSEKGEKILKKNKIKKPFILYVGNSFPYKNLELVLNALAKLDEKITFVYVSARDSFSKNLVEKAKQMGLEDRVVCTGYLSDEDLNWLFRSATCFVFPSLAEGFGLTGLEAMAAGCPVVASSIPVFKEIYGKAALFFDPLNSDELGKKIEEIVKYNSLRESLIAEGLKQVKVYSWKRMAQETLAVYEKVNKG